MSNRTKLGGRFTFPGTDVSVYRMGYGAMQLAGPGVYGPPRDHDAALAVLREAMALGIDHIDTSDFYGPHVTNQIIAEALHPYPQGLTIVTKVGAKRGTDKSWNHAHSKQDLVAAVHDNLKNLRVEALDVVNLRLGDVSGPSSSTDAVLESTLGTLIELKEQGLVRHLGVSNFDAAQVQKARAMTDIVCVQNLYNLAHRDDDALIDDLAKDGIAYVPFFPLGGFTPLQSSTLEEVATSLESTPLQTALAWLLHRAPNILLIPGTSSVAHLRENVAAAALELPPKAMERLNSIGRG